MLDTCVHSALAAQWATLTPRPASRQFSQAWPKGDRVLSARQIETAEQVRWLRELGCELGQGYHFGAPLAAEELDAFLRA